MRSWPYYDLHEHGDEPRRPWWNKLSRRGEIVAGIAMVIALIMIMWLTGALSTWLTGVPG